MQPHVRLAIAVAALSVLQPHTSRAQRTSPRPADCGAGLAPAAHVGAVLPSLRALETFAALSEALTDDAVLLWPGAPILAARDARTLLAGAHREAAARLQWQPLGLRVSADSSLAATWGTLLRAPSGSTGPSIASEARFIAVHRFDGACWRLAALMLEGLPARDARATTALALPESAARFAETDRAFAIDAAANGAGPAFARFADPQAQMRDRDGLVVQGPAAIGRLVDGLARWRWAPVTGGGAGSGDLGWTAGNAVITGPDGTPRYSKYLTIWLRGDGDRIRFLTDGGSARPAD